MDKLNQILNHPVYKKQLAAIEAYEATRIFCGHDFQHFLDVSRIGYILVMEKGLQVSKEVVYGYGFLHDIGRAVEYGGGASHDQASVEIAEVVLKESDYTTEEVEQIIRAIKSHRNRDIRDKETFEGLMVKADKVSRACWQCPAETQCNWDSQKKNSRVEV